ncbi:MAG: nitroreductase family protein [Ruminococcus bromii]|nr:nitroreductase family protein [Ruminococcus bromii]
MEFMETVRARRSIRKFDTRAVEPEKLDRLLEAARLCQSAKNRQPWRFMLLTGAEKDKIAQIMLRLFEQNNYDIPGYMNSSKYTAQTMLQAPALILVFREPDDGWFPMDMLSIGAAVEHICLAAVNEGLGSLWIGDTAYIEAEIRAHLGCTELELICAVSVGYAAEDPAPRPRKAMEEILLEKGAENEN